MEPSIAVGLLWMLFGCTHIGLASRAVRGALVARLGERGFTVLFSLVAAAAFALLISYYATHRFAGAPGPGLGHTGALRHVLVTCIGGGIALIVGSLFADPRSPVALFGRTIGPPWGIERITRHGFLAGIVLFALPHALLAERLVGSVAFGGMALFAVIGARHQDAKLLVLRGAPYADYLASTSALPFGAVSSGRQRIAWRELPHAALGAGVGLAFALRAVHGAILDFGGAWVIASALGLAAVGIRQTWRSGGGAAASNAESVERMAQRG